MMRFRWRLWLWTWIGLFLMGGCAQRRGPSPLAADISPARNARKQQVVEDFREQQDLAQYQAAVMCWEQGNLAGCRESLASLLTRNPEHFEANYLLAELYFLNDQPAEARPILERLIERSPEAAAVHHTLSLVLERLGQRDGAIAHARHATELAGDNERYRNALAALETEIAGVSDVVRAEWAAHRTPAETAGGDTADKAKPHGGSDALVNDVPPEFRAAYDRGDLQRAKAILLRAARREAHNEAGLIRVAVAALRQDQPAWAIQVLRTFQEADVASAGYRRALGTAYYHAGEYAAAEVQLRQALLLDNTSALSYFLLGCTLSRQQRQAEAETHLQQARLLDSRFERADLLP